MKLGKAEVHWRAHALSEVRFEDQQLTSFAELVVFQPQVTNTTSAGVANSRLGGTSGYASTYGGGNGGQGPGSIFAVWKPAPHSFSWTDAALPLPGTAGVFWSANQIPVAALERIQVIPRLQVSRLRL